MKRPDMTNATEQVMDYARRAGVAVDVYQEKDGVSVILTIDGHDLRFFGWNVEAMCAQIDAAAEG
jgi:hypothetical protein